MQKDIFIHGGALAGCAAAISARRSGAERVRVYEKSPFPRHKVCGEFLSAGVEPVLRELQIWSSFQSLSPAPITRLGLHFPRKSLQFRLPETCWGISRYALDTWLMREAIDAGAGWELAKAPEREAATDSTTDNVPENSTVLAYGRQDAAPKGNRTFGFKAHHQGPASDSIDLYFFDGCYVGINPAENGVINVCGLGPESVLAAHRFDYSQVCSRNPALRDRLLSLNQQMGWLSVGPLVYGNRFKSQLEDSIYPAGDALGFVDPFTGSGMLNALLSGMLAGRAAALHTPVQSYLAECRQFLHRPFTVSMLFRAAVRSGVAERFVGCVPGSLLFRLTRAHMG